MTNKNPSEAFNPNFSREMTSIFLFYPEKRSSIFRSSLYTRCYVACAPRRRHADLETDVWSGLKLTKKKKNNYMMNRFLDCGVCVATLIP